MPPCPGCRKTQRSDAVRRPAPASSASRRGMLMTHLNVSRSAPMSLLSRGTALFGAAAVFLILSSAFCQGLPSETPATFTPRVEGFDYAQREVMIPMRDGVKLKAVILIPKGAQ